MQSLSAARHFGIIDITRSMITTEGILRPMRGIGAVILGAGPAHAAYFSSYEYIKKNLSSNILTSNHNYLGQGNLTAKQNYS